MSEIVIKLYLGHLADDTAMLKYMTGNSIFKFPENSSSIDDYYLAMVEWFARGYRNFLTNSNAIVSTCLQMQIEQSISLNICLVKGMVDIELDDECRPKTPALEQYFSGMGEINRKVLTSRRQFEKPPPSS